jgi:signal peptidase I
MIKDKPQFRPKLRLPSFLLEILQTILFVIVVTVLFDMAIPRSLVDGHSMQPTFEDADRLIVSRIHFLFSPPQRGDVIVLNSVNPRDPETMLIKRVIGLPGERLEIIDKQVHINGQVLDEPYTLEDCRTRCTDEVWELGASEYFVMGDNRNHSSDSRSFGVVNIDHIVGRVVFRYWPISRIGLISEPDYPELNR